MLYGYYKLSYVLLVEVKLVDSLENSLTLSSEVEYKDVMI